MYLFISRVGIPHGSDSSWNHAGIGFVQYTSFLHALKSQNSLIDSRHEQLLISHISFLER